MSDNENLQNALRYDFAKRCFLDIADYDYISARTLFKNSCKDQSLIFMQQCIEKYLKAILLYNKRPSNNPVTKPIHDLKKLLKKCQDEVDGFNLSKVSIKFILELNGIEHSRYLAYSYYGIDMWLFILDQCIWQLRIYAQPDMILYKQKINKILAEGLEMYIGRPIIPNGELERIFADRKSQNKILRGNLIWKNFFYGIKKKRSVKNVQRGFWAKNSPFNVGGDRQKKMLYETVKDLVFIPKDMRIELEKL